MPAVSVAFTEEAKLVPVLVWHASSLPTRQVRVEQSGPSSTRRTVSMSAPQVSMVYSPLAVAV